MINWTKLNVEDVKFMANWAIKIGFFRLANTLIQDLEEYKKLARASKYVIIKP